ncbi:LPS export ABC transporter permease LptF [Alkanindiges illinoisensis]|uniref:LPS export ABC transporter permease LptF n=1 Tax=Alkanindiges illinoisensis TaxID=197183 RepID=UPI00047A9A89|nr:LPS export ABC transporter permease LptF [Alkanindiges illinoisensis]
MIIRRYLVRQVLSTSAVTLSLCTLILLGGRLIKYFGTAAQGRLDASVLFTIIAFRLPEFLTLTLPLGFFVGLMLVFGRLYVDHEMAVLNSSGVSRDSLGVLLIPMTLLLIVAEAALVIQITPWGNRKFDQLYATQAVRSAFDLVQPREFISNGRYTIYAGSLSDDRRDLQDIFFYEHSEQPNKPDMLIMAERATRVVDPTNRASVVDLTRGRRYEIYPGKPEYTHAEFATYRLRIEHESDPELGTQRVEAMSMTALTKRLDEPVVRSEFGWRLSAPWVMALALILALPLSQVNPRQGRYYRLIPAILIFASLIVALIAVKTRITKDQLGLWGYPLVLVIYLVVGLLLSRRQRLSPQAAKRIKEAART